MVRKSEFITGIFILAALAVLIVVAIQPAKTTFGSGNRVIWEADFDNVALLKDRARVSVAGLDVGQVLSREFHEVEKTDPTTGQTRRVLNVRVRMMIDADFAETCHRGTIASIQAESLLGDKFVQIIPALTGDPLPKVDDAYLIESDPFGDWMSMLKDLKEQLGGPAEELLTSLNVTVNKLNEEMLTAENIAHLSGILKNAEAAMIKADEMVAKLNRELEDPEGLLAQAREAARGGASVLGKLDRDYDEIKGGLMDTLGNADKVLDNGNEQINRIGDILKKADPKLQNILDTVNNRLPEVLDNLEKTLDEAQTMMQGIDQTVRNKDVAGLLYDSRVTMQELTLTLRALRADFSQLIWGGPGVAQPAVPDPKNDLKSIQTGKPDRYGY